MGINDGDYGFDNLQQFDVTWYHRFSKTVQSRSERRRPCCELHHARARYERSNLPCRCAALHGAGNTPLRIMRRRSFSPKLFISFRSEVVNDRRGQRTGYATKYSENTVSLTK